MTTSVSELENVRDKRTFLPKEFSVTDWETLKPFYVSLEEREVGSLDDMRQWLRDLNELQSVVAEDVGWRYINMTRDTRNQEAGEMYRYFVKELSPRISEYENILQKKFYDSQWKDQLEGPEYEILSQLVAKNIELFREENIPLFSDVSVKSQEYNEIIGALTIEWEGEQLTLQQAGSKLQSRDRELRESVWRKISEKRLEEKAKLDVLFNEMRDLRDQAASNAGYDSYTDFRFRDLGRFDYDRKDVEAFHNAVEKVVKPFNEKLLTERKKRLGVDALRPWDLRVDVWGENPLRPFGEAEELAEKTINVLRRIQPELGDMIEIMKGIRHLDLDSRLGKAPGGYNYPLYETGVPFIFMNAVGMQSDLRTMVHECGHAVHSFLTRNLELVEFKDVPSEVAELASMAMELLTMDYWDEFYDDQQELTRARIQQLTGTLNILPWIATVDAFQQWIYDNPKHTAGERAGQWLHLHKRFLGDAVDWSGLEDARSYLWHAQLHIFEVPFYYIEYGIAQLGALQVWMNFRKDPEFGLQKYLEGLSLGYTRPIPDIYAAADIEFNFTEKKVSELVAYVEKELDALKTELEAA